MLSQFTSLRDFRLLWIVFAALIVAGGLLVFGACGTGSSSFFALSCPVPPSFAAVDAEQAKAAELAAQIHAAEIKLALLPACPRPPAQKPEVKQPEKPQQEALEIPKKLEDLKGCWQSKRGDIKITSDDEESRLIGYARICYCFGNTGRGHVEMRYQDGDVCRTNLMARILPDQLLMHHEKVKCFRHNPYVAANIHCKNSDADKTSCEIEDLGNNHGKYTEEFIRVGEDYCGVGG